MILIRFLILAAVTVIGLSALFYFFTRDRRYLRFAWGLLKIGLLFVAVFLVLAALERIVLI